MGIVCDKCNTKCEHNEKDFITYQTIKLFDRKLQICNDCAEELYKDITGISPDCSEKFSNPKSELF